MYSNLQLPATSLTKKNTTATTVYFCPVFRLTPKPSAQLTPSRGYQNDVTQTTVTPVSVEGLASQQKLIEQDALAPSAVSI